jgi:hypothetical protein
MKVMAADAERDTGGPSREMHTTIKRVGAPSDLP